MPDYNYGIQKHNGCGGYWLDKLTYYRCTRCGEIKTKKQDYREHVSGEYMD